jgi:hypothetical protein
MLTSLPTRLRAPTDYHTVLAPPCLESAPRGSRQPSNPSVRFTAAKRTRSAMTNFAPFRARLAVSTLRRRHSIPIHPPR